APRRGARRTRAGRHPGRRPDHERHPRAAAGARRGELPVRRAGRKGAFGGEADRRRLRGPQGGRPLRVRLRHGREGLLAQPPGDPGDEGRLGMLAIIGGSGLSKLGNMEVTQRKIMRTPYGEPSGALTFGRIAAKDVVFLARHGYGHTIAPHQVNYRANLWALKEAGADAVVSVASVGGIRNDLGPGVLVLPDQIIDYTWGRASTFFEGVGAPVNHIDFTEPYSAPLRRRLLAAAARCGEPIV